MATRIARQGKSGLATCHLRARLCPGSRSQLVPPPVSGLPLTSPRGRLTRPSPGERLIDRAGRFDEAAWPSPGFQSFPSRAGSPSSCRPEPQFLEQPVDALRPSASVTPTRLRKQTEARCERLGRRYNRSVSLSGCHCTSRTGSRGTFGLPAFSQSAGLQTPSRTGHPHTRRPPIPTVAGCPSRAVSQLSSGSRSRCCSPRSPRRSVRTNRSRW
jgi:hypothetical protein